MYRKSRFRTNYNVVDIGATSSTRCDMAPVPCSYIFSVAHFSFPSFLYYILLFNTKYKCRPFFVLFQLPRHSPYNILLPILPIGCYPFLSFLSRILILFELRMCVRMNVQLVCKLEPDVYHTDEIQSTCPPFPSPAPLPVAIQHCHSTIKPPPFCCAFQSTRE